VRVAEGKETVEGKWMEPVLVPVLALHPSKPLV
jgi:hypothetical protein